MLNRKHLPIQFACNLNLDPAGSDCREQIRRATCDLAPGVIVRVHTRGIKPPPFGIPFVNALDYVWYRPDLAWQFIDDNPDCPARWHENIRNIVGGI
jgi:hypothetical protein